MTSEVNFLPEELKPKGFALKLSKKLKRVATVSLAVFFATFFLYLATSSLFSFELRRYNSEEESLKGQIAALEGTEQQLVLAQDRLGKIDTVLASNDSKEEIDIAQQVISRGTENVSFEEISLNKDSVIFTIVTDTSFKLTRFVSQLVSSNFRSVRILSFNFTKDKGYKVEVSVSGQ